MPLPIRVKRKMHLLSNDREMVLLAVVTGFVSFRVGQLYARPLDTPSAPFEMVWSIKDDTEELLLEYLSIEEQQLIAQQALDEVTAVSERASVEMVSGERAEQRKEV